MRAIDPRGTFPYVLECDRKAEPDEQVTFHIRALTQAERESVVKRLAKMSQGDVNANPAVVNRDILALGLNGWDNFKDAAGNIVTFTTGPRSNFHSSSREAFATDECLGCIPFGYWDELCAMILNQAELRSDDRKN